ncbi:uncharacterized protein LOC114945036 isoform X1 [Nylanderia fulva]|uniref:uncharacterized protein LOC114945036 isoform X1 n=1 Tax=Nylanderia fulva TaxID=613905 RepID=UPI0010FB9CE7|nr:uncharacterized protein LOC114945036 isoform X1 [Nylanderia fulva]
MDTLQEYIFGTLNFRVCRSVPEDIKCLCIDYVLQSKFGEEIIVNTIFHSVARRLGLRCDVVDIMSHCCISWKPEFVTNNLENARCFYIKDEKFPNCLHNYLQNYDSYKTYDFSKIKTEQINLQIRTNIIDNRMLLTYT